MQGRDLPRHQAARRVVEFVLANRGRLGNILETNAVKELLEQVEFIDRLAQRQGVSDRTSSQQLSVVEGLRKELNECYFNVLDDISRYERTVNNRTDWPILDKPANGVGIGKFLPAGQTIATLARRRTEELSRWGVSLDGLDKMLAALEEAHIGQEMARVGRVSSTDVLPGQVSKEMKAVKIIGRLIRARFRDDEHFLAMWSAASTVVQPQPKRLLWGELPRLPGGESAEAPKQLSAGETASDQPQLSAGASDREPIRFMATTPQALPPKSPTLSLAAGTSVTAPSVGQRVSGVLRRWFGLAGKGPGSAPPPVQ